jgi:serine/threonine-protein kinase
MMEEPSITADGQVFGTPSYMSPEQVAGRPLDVRTDLFSLGVMLFEMLTGKKPFTGDSVVTITYNIMNQEIMVPPTVAPYLERVIRRALSKDPNQRYGTAEEMAAELDAKSFNGFGYQSQPDPFGSTMSAPGPLYDPQVQYPGQPLPGQTPYPGQQPVPQMPLPPVNDAFGGLRPDQFRLPKLPRKPAISAEAAYFLKVMTAVILICAVLIGFFWMFSSAYRGYQRQGGQQQINIYLENGKRYFENQSYEAAIEEFKQVLRVATDPKLVKVTSRNIAACYLQIGIQFDNSGKVYDAIGQYRQALIVDKNYADAYLYLGNAFERLGRTVDAFLSWENAGKVEPGSRAATVANENAANLYVKLGDQEYHNGHTDAAMDNWRKAMETAPGTKAGIAGQERIEQITGAGN